MFDLRGVVLSGEILARLFKEGLGGLVALMPAETGGGFKQSFADEGLDGLTESGVFLGGLNDGLGLAGEALEFFLHVDDDAVGLLPGLEGLSEDGLIDLARARLHHNDGVAGTGDDEIEVAVVCAAEGIVDDDFAVDVSDVGSTNGALEWDVRDGESR